jgi:predicted permease
MNLSRWGIDFLRDVQYGFRVMRRGPLFAVVAIGSLALGIGGAASVFTVLNAVVLRSLPVPNPQQIFAAEQRGPADASPRFSWPAIEAAREAVQGRATVAASTGTSGMQIRRGGSATSVPGERGQVVLVSGEYFDVLGQRPLLGRFLAPSDNERVDAHPVAVISDAYWERQFRRSPSAVGSHLIINGTSFTIVGVARPGFFGAVLALRNPDAWIPLVMQSAVRYASNASMSDEADGRKPWAPQAQIEWLSMIVRVPDARQIDPVAATLTVLHQRADLARVDASDAAARRRLQAETVGLTPAGRGLSSLRDNLQTPLVVLLAMVGVLLAIACGNVASLLLARASARDREIAIRLSMGAGRLRVARQLLAETLLLAMLGGGLGLMVAAWGRDLLIGMFSQGATIIDLDTRFDWRVLAFAAGVTILTGLAAGLVPAVRGSRSGLAEAMKSQGRVVGVGGGRRGVLVGKFLVTAQIAFCLLLLVVAGLFARSMRSLLQVDVGYDRAELLVARMDVHSIGYAPDQRQALYERILQRLRAVPGVESVSASLNGPMARSERTSSMVVEGHVTAQGETLLTNEEVVTDDYFATVGLRLLEGRLFSAEDRRLDSRSSIINESMAKRFFPAGGAVGKRWSYGDTIEKDSPVVIGVVQDAKYVALRGRPPNMIYHLATARPDDVLSNVEVRTTMPPATLVASVRQAVTEIAPTLPLFDIVPLEERLNRGVANDRLVARLTATFGGIALLLACLGLYGTISYGVARRVTELGVRMALGARRGDVLWLVIREALVLVSIGGAVGVSLSLLAGRGIGSMLYGVRAIDPASYATGLTLLVAVASLAAYVPARRASRIDPMVALRKD